MEIDNENNYVVNSKSQNNLLLSKEESSSTTLLESSIEKLDSSTPRFHYKRTVNPKKSKSNISNSQRRLINDLEELKNNKNIRKTCEVVIGDYKRIIDTDNFEMVIEFKNYFSTKFIFFPDYPFSPPSITFLSGNKSPNIFDSDGNILLEIIKKSKWTPTLWLSTLINSIELLISKEGLNNNKYHSNDLFPKEGKYGKRKWDDYLKEEKSISKKDTSETNVLKKKLK